MTDDASPTPPDGEPSPQQASPVEPSPGDAAPSHWYDNRAAVGAVIALGLAGILLLVGWLVWGSDDDETAGEGSISTASVVTGSTLDQSPDSTTTSTIPTGSVVQGEVLDNVTLPSTTSTTSTTTSTSTTVASTTTAASTTVVTTTVASTTTAPADTTTTNPGISVPPSPAATLLDVIAASPDLSRLRAAVGDVGLDLVLDGEEPITIFAPTDSAFATLDAAPGGSELLSDPDRLEALLLRHITPGSLDSTAVLSVEQLDTLNGDTLAVDASDQTIDGAALTVIDVETANGFLHVVDAVLIAPPAP